MEISEAAFGVSGERDEEHFVGFHPLGSQVTFVEASAEGVEVVLGARFNSRPEELLLLCWRSGGRERPLAPIPYASPFFGQVVRSALAMKGVERVLVQEGRLLSVDPARLPR